MTEDDLMRWEGQAMEATPAPWLADFGEASPHRSGLRGAYMNVLGHEGIHLATVWEHNPHGNPTDDCRNGAFIAEAREAVPALCAEVRRLRARLADGARSLGGLLAAALDEERGF